MQSRNHANGVSVRARCSVLLLLFSGAYDHAAPAQGVDSSTDIPVRMHGVVVNAVTQAPISRALVTTVDRRMALMTDDKGRFEFEIKASASHTSVLRGVPGEAAVFFVAKKPGYLVTGRPTLLLITDQSMLKAEVRLQLMPESTVSGIIAAPGGDPPSGVTVQLLRKLVQDGAAFWMQTEVQETNARGRFRFGGLMPGEYKVVTTEWIDPTGPYPPPGGKPMVGYPAAAYPNGSKPTTAGIIHLTGGRSVEADINLRPVPYYSVEIPVVGNSQTDFVRVAVAGEDGSIYSLGFNGRTQRLEGALPDGVYHLTVTDNPVQPELNKAPILFTGSEELTVAGKPTQGSPIKLLPGITIPVNVREEYTGPDPDQQAAASQPAATADAAPGTVSQIATQAVQPILQEPEGKIIRPRPVEVFLGSEDRSAGGFGLRNSPPDDPESESLVIESVSPGSFRVQITPRRGYVASATANGVNLLRQQLVIAPGATAPTIAIILRDDTATITGKVSLGESKEATSSVPRLVWAYPLEDSEEGRPASGFEQPDGKFSISNVVPGRYLVLASKVGSINLEYRNRDVMKAYESKGVIVTVSSGQTIDVELKEAVLDDNWPEMETME